MPVKYYEWGTEGGSGGGSGGGGGVSGTPEVFEGVLGAGATTLTFSATSAYVVIRNTHDTDSLEYSYDSGTTWFIALAYQVIQEPVGITSLQLRAVGAGAPTYEVTAVIPA